MSSKQPSSTLAVDGVPIVELDGGPYVPSRKGLDFWMVILAICVSLFLSALELTALGNALPTIIHDLQGEQFVWVSAAYALASAALLPASGGFAQVFGRRISMLLSLSIFAVGSALCGSARSLTWLIAARTIQGAGGGIIVSLSNTIISDLVPLRERGTYSGLISMTWAIAACIGPLIGGLLAEAGQWRWLFYLNLPVCAVAAALVMVFMKLPTPLGTLRGKLALVDWLGSVIIIAASSSCVIALTWGGIRFSWLSVQVLVPLIIGFVGIIGFLFYEARLAQNPIVPFALIKNRTSISGYIQTFLGPLVLFCVIFFYPTYLQACQGLSPSRAGVLGLPFCFSFGPALIGSGISVSISKAFRPQLWLGWILLVAAMASMTTLRADTSAANYIAIPILVGFGTGIIYSTTYFPVLSPLAVTNNAYAMAFLAFCRSLAGAWGVAIGTVILQTQLSKRLPSEFLVQFPGGISFAYSVVPVVKTLPEPLRTQVREAFADSIAVIWEVMIGISALGFIASLGMKAYPLHTGVDDKWTMDNGQIQSVDLTERQESSQNPVD